MREHCCCRPIGLLLPLVLSLQAPCIAAPNPVPPSPYLGIVYRYADALLQHGRDTYGPQSTGLFLSALDRRSLGPLTNRPKPPAGIPESIRAGEPDGALVGAVPLYDSNLLRLLYTLSELSSKPVYREAADSELKWFLQNASQGQFARAPWSEGSGWNTVDDRPIGLDAMAKGRRRAWMLWDRCFELAPDVSKEWTVTAANGLTDTDTSPNRAGYLIRGLASARQSNPRDSLLGAVESLLKPLETASIALEKSDLRSVQIEDSGASWLSMAIDCDGAAKRMPTPLTARLLTLARRVDQIFCSLPHDLKERHGFAQTSNPTETKRVTPLWSAGVGQPTTAQIGMLCVSRYENTGDIRYREFVHAAADAYLSSLPEDDVDAWPLTFGQAISLELAAWRSTSRQEYLDRAIKLADTAVKTFWTDGPLPKASVQSDHYESITGSDTLALALVELHLSILHITAVRCPPNTIDR